MKVEQGLSWDGLGFVDQWLWLIRMAYASGTLTAIPFSRKLESDLRSGMSLLLREHRKTFSDPQPPRDVPKNLNPTNFFSNFYKQILRALDFALWAELLEELEPTNNQLTRREALKLCQLSIQWGNLLSANRRVRLEAIPVFLQALAETLGWQLKKPIELGNELIHMVEIRGLSVGFPPISPLIITFVPKNEGSAARALEWIEGVIHRLATLKAAGGEIAINIVIGNGTQANEYSRLLRKDKGYLLVDETSLKQILSADRYGSELESVIKSSLGLQRLNPYRSEGPVDRPEMFYGRKDEVATILNSSTQNFMVVGSRRIGKSSLLARLLHDTAASESRRPVMLDCANIKTPQDFAERLAARINPKRLHRIQIGRLAQAIRAARSTSEVPFLLLLDEADGIIQLAREHSDWTILNVLRELSNTGAVQCVIAGYKALYEAWQDLSTPLYNFVNPLYLSVLSEESARKLVTEPLRKLGVTFKENELLQQIIDESGCHPAFLQFFCSELIRHLDKDSGHLIGASHINFVRETQDYREFVLKPYNFEENLSRLERWLVLSLAHARQHYFSSHLVLEAFGSKEPWLHIENVAKALRDLELAGLIRVRGLSSKTERGEDKLGLQYIWTIPAFPLTLDSSLDIESHIAELTKELANRKGVDR